MDFSAANSDASQPRPLCHCLDVQADEVHAAIVEDDLSTVRGVTKSCGAGGGCNACHRHIKRMLHEHALQQRMSGEPVSSTQTALEYA